MIFGDVGGRAEGKRRHYHIALISIFSQWEKKSHSLLYFVGLSAGSCKQLALNLRSETQDD
jgi:hypothetical protein